MKKILLLTLGLSSLVGIFSSVLAKDVMGLRVCNETGEKIYITVSWILPGDDSYSFLTRESSVSKSKLGVFSSKCRIFGPVPEILSVSWLSEAQWNKLDKARQDKLQGKDRSQLGLEHFRWYKPQFVESNFRQITVSKNKNGKMYVKQDKEWTLNPAKMKIFKNLNPFSKDDKDDL